MTEVTGRVFGTVGLKECGVVGATGKLLSNSEAKIVDPDTGIGLPPMMPGELWLRGPSVMKGIVLYSMEHFYITRPSWALI